MLAAMSMMMIMMMKIDIEEKNNFSEIQIGRRIYDNDDWAPYVLSMRVCF